MSSTTPLTQAPRRRGTCSTGVFCAPKALIPISSGLAAPTLGETGIGQDLQNQIDEYAPKVLRLISSWTPPILMALAALATAILLIRGVVAHRARSKRLTVALVPSSDFDPTVEDIHRFASELARSQPVAMRRFLPSSVRTTRLRFSHAGSGQMVHELTVPHRSRSVVTKAPLHSVDFVLTDEEPVNETQPSEPSEPEPDDKRRVHTSRAELILSRNDAWPLRDVPLTPDPLTPLAAVFSQFDDHYNEKAEVIIDLMPLTRAQINHRRTQLVNEHSPDQKTSNKGQIVGGAIDGTFNLVDDLLGDLMGGPRGGSSSPSNQFRSSNPPRPKGVGRLDTLNREQTIAKNARDLAPHFQIQVLLRVSSTEKHRANGLLHALLSSFEPFAGENYFKTRGLYFFGGFAGTDRIPWRRAFFDRRISKGLFRPAKNKAIVSSQAIGGLIKPVTKHCNAPNVARSGGVVPPPPAKLPNFVGAANQMPWGEIERNGRTSTFAVNLSDTFFTWTVGRSRYGKTETNLCRFVHLARTGHSCVFLDPHHDAVQRAKPYLIGLEDRVIELSLARGMTKAGQVGWNPISMQGLSSEHIEDRTTAIVDSLAGALGWGSTKTPRALSITQMATQSLVELALRLPDDVAPTLFTLSTILTNENWRERIVPLLSRQLQDYWREEFTRLPPEAVTPITNTISRMRSMQSVSALFGQSQSTYNLRNAIDSGKIVLVGLRGKSQIDQLIASFVAFDLLSAVMSRWDTDPSKRIPVHAFMDEVQSYDHAVKGLLESALEEGGKYGLRLHLMNQKPDRLSPATFGAITTNRSHMATTAVGIKSADLLAGEWGKQIAASTISDLPKYQFITQVTQQGNLSAPFRAGGLSLENLYDPPPIIAADGTDRLEALQDQIHINSGLRPMAVIQDEIDTLDDRILEAIHHHRSGNGRPLPTQPPSPGLDRKTVSIRKPNQQPQNVVPIRRPTPETV